MSSDRAQLPATTRRRVILTRLSSAWVALTVSQGVLQSSSGQMALCLRMPSGRNLGNVGCSLLDHRRWSVTRHAVSSSFQQGRPLAGWAGKFSNVKSVQLVGSTARWSRKIAGKPVSPGRVLVCPPRRLPSSEQVRQSPEQGKLWGKGGKAEDKRAPPAEESRLLWQREGAPRGHIKTGPVLVTSDFHRTHLRQFMMAPCKHVLENCQNEPRCCQ